MKKYKITGVKHPRMNAWRIQAVRDLPSLGVKHGELGGFVESEQNLSHDGESWVGGDAVVRDRAVVKGSAVMRENSSAQGTAVLSDHARLFGRAHIGDHAWMGGRAMAFDDTRILGAASVSGHVRLFGQAIVSGAAAVREEAVVRERARVFGSAVVRGGARLEGRAVAEGAARVAGNARLHGGARVTGGIVEGDADVCEESHVLATRVEATESFDATLVRCRNEDGHLLTVGCYQGSVAEFRSMIESEQWINANAQTRHLRRPELLAFTDMCEARMATWEMPARTKTDTHEE